MKNLLLTSALAVVLTAMGSVEPLIEWKSKSLNIGSVKSGEKITFEYNFENLGSESLRILEAKGSCGCTVLDFPTSEIKPGHKGIIKVAFQSSQLGSVNKTVKVLTSVDEQPIILKFIGEVTD